MIPFPVPTPVPVEPFIPITLFSLAERYIGTKEVPGLLHSPVIMAMLHLDNTWPEGDEVAWCSAALNWWAWHLRLPRSKSLRARSWLLVGRPVTLAEARPGFDVVVLSRGPAPQPGPEDLTAPGHAGLFAGREGQSRLHVLGGNQADSVSVALFQVASLLGVRRLL